MAYGLSNSHVTDDVTWLPRTLWGSTVGYPSDSLASCFTLNQTNKQIPVCINYENFDFISFIYCKW